MAINNISNNIPRLASVEQNHLVSPGQSAKVWLGVGAGPGLFFLEETNANTSKVL